MATKHEIQQAERAKQKQLVNAVGGTAAGIGTQLAKQYAYKAAVRQGGQTLTQARGIYGGELIAGAIDLVANLGIAAWQFATQRKRAKKREKLTQKQQQVREGVDGILDTIENEGLNLVNQGFEPGTGEFENQLYKQLFSQIGYRGNCNIIAWAPGSRPTQGVRPYLFKVTGNGRKLTPGPGLVNVPNLENYWYVRCKSAKDTWVTAYIQKLTAEGRVRELEAFQASLNKGKLIVRVVFGLLMTAFLIVFAIQATRIK